MNEWLSDDEGERGHLWNAYEAHIALGIPPGTIRSWVSRGRLAAAERPDGRGRAQFWERDLRALVEANAVLPPS